jgi:hypothetical protein
MGKFKVGQRVRLLIDIWEEADEFGPAGYLGNKGDELTIKKISVYESRPDHEFIGVAHDHVTNGACFNVSKDEIELIQKEPV